MCRATFHESVAVEIAWTVDADRHRDSDGGVCHQDGSGDERHRRTLIMTIKATGYQWKWGYDYLKGEGEGISFISNLATPRDQIDGNAPKGENYMLEVDNEVVVPVNKKVRIITDGTGCDSRLDDSVHSVSSRTRFPVSFAIRISGLRKSASVPRSMRRVVWQGTRLHADRGATWCRMPITPSGWTARRRSLPPSMDDPNKQWTPEELKVRGEKVYAANCVACHQASRQGRPRQHSRRWKVRRSSMGRRITRSPFMLNGPSGFGDGRVQAVVGRRNCCSDRLTPVPAGATRVKSPPVADIKAARAWDAAKMVHACCQTVAAFKILHQTSL